MASSEREVYEAVYKLSTEGHEKVIAAIGDIHKSVMDLTKDLAFKPIGFQTISVEAEKAKKSIESISDALRNVPKKITGLKDAFKGASQTIKFSAELDAEKTSKQFKSALEEIKAKVPIEAEGTKGLKGLKELSAEFATMKTAASAMGDEFYEGYASTFRDIERKLERWQKGELKFQPKDLAALSDTLEDKAKDLEKALTVGGKKLKKDLTPLFSTKNLGKGADKFASAFSSLRDPVSFLKGTGNFGESIQQWSKKIAEDRKKQKAMQALSKGGLAKGGSAGAAAGGEAGAGAAMGAIGKLAGVAGVVLGVVAAVAVLVKIILDADSAIKDLNKSIFDSVGAGNMVADAFGTAADMTAVFQQRLGIMQEAANDFSYFMRTGIKPEEFAASVGAMTKAGYTFGDIISGAGDNTQIAAKKIQDAISQANMISRNFGVGLTEASDIIGDWHRNLAMSTDDISESFLAMQSAAKDSRMDITKVFNLIKDVSADFVLFGVRTKEVTGMLELLGKTVGPKKAAEMLGTLAKSMTNMSDQDRIRIVALAGYGPAFNEMSKSQMRLKDSTEKLAASQGVSLKSDADYEASLKGNAAAYQRLTARYKDTKGWDEIDRQMQKYTQNAREMQQGMVGVSTALASADLTAQIEIQMKAFERIAGPIENAAGVQAMAARQQLGMSLEQQKVWQGIAREERKGMDAQIAQTKLGKASFKDMNSLLKGDKKDLKFAMVGNDLMKKNVEGTWDVATRSDFMTKELSNQAKKMEDQKTVAEMQKDATLSMSAIMEQGFKNLILSIGMVVDTLMSFSLFSDKGLQLQRDAQKQLIGLNDLSKGNPKLAELSAASTDILAKLGPNITKDQATQQYLSEVVKKSGLDTNTLLTSLVSAGLISADYAKATLGMIEKGTLTAEGAQQGVAAAIAAGRSGVGGPGIDLKKDLGTFLKALAGGSTSKDVKSQSADLTKSVLAAVATADAVAQKEMASDLIKKIQGAGKTKESKEEIKAREKNSADEKKALGDQTTDLIDNVKKYQLKGETIEQAMVHAQQRVGLLKELEDLTGKSSDGFSDFDDKSIKGLRDALKKAKAMSAEAPAKSPSGAKQDFLVSKSGYVKLSAGDIAFNPSEAARGMATKAGGLAGTAISRLASSGAPTGPGGASANITRNQSNTFNINGGNIQDVRRTIEQVLTEDKRREAEGIAR